MKAVLLREVGVVELVDIEEPEPAGSEVVVDVAVSGICGSDVHAARDGGLLRTPPVVMGHEFSGTFDGRRVAVNPMINCGACIRCQRGQPHLCSSRTIVGIQRAGGLAQRVVVPESCLVDLPEHVSMEAGAMVEPLAVAHHAVGLCPPQPSDRVGILGAGTIGLLVAYVCGSLTDDVSVADPNQHRLGFARTLGVENTDVTLHGDFDIIFDAVGNANTHRLSLEHLRSGGTTVWVGNENPDAAFDAQMLVRIEQRVIGSAAYTPEDFVAAVGMIDDRVLEWVTVQSIDDAPEMIYNLMEPKPDGPIKVSFRL